MKRLFVQALKNVFDMDNEDAMEIAKKVAIIFHGEDEIEDMDIDKYSRSLFYELQREKLLKIRREEIKDQGKQIRKYYWSFNERVIKEEAYKKYEELSPYQVYQNIPQKAWVAHTVNT